jgi:activator of HSP90 ATPase
LLLLSQTFPKTIGDFTQEGEPLASGKVPGRVDHDPSPCYKSQRKDSKERGKRMKTKTIRQSVVFTAGPREVYESLMDTKKHALFTGAGAKISRKIGGRIMAYDGYIDGINLELIPDKKIVQSWRGSDWPEGHYSRATFSLRKTKGGTQLLFTQSGVPEDQYAAISQGWREHYWKKMKERLPK